jgi:biopolymer transport protein ExbB/TolQ
MLMDAAATVQLVVALAAVAAAVFAFNQLMGRGPRGTMWIAAACPFMWSMMLPFLLGNPDDGTLSRQADVFLTVLFWMSIVGFALGALDMLQQRRTNERHPTAEFLLRQPLLWGLVACTVFFALLHQGVINSPLLQRYCAGHPIEYIEMTVFFVGLAALGLRLIDVVGQFPSLKCQLLEPVPFGGQAVGDCDQLLAKLDELGSFSEAYVVRRLRGAIDFVRRKNSAADLDAHLRHLEELEGVQINAAYSMVRIIIWAIPILGLLGTVIGITIAVANLNPETLEESMTKVTHGLGVAFDHTATALSLTMLLMFTKSAVERVEDSLLARVDARVSEELVGRFQSGEEKEADPNVAAIRRMTGQVVEAIETLAGRQADIWKSTISDVHQQWADVSLSAGKLVKDSLATTINASLDNHAQVLRDGALHHANQLSDSAAMHTEKLERSAQQTVGRLRDGLEKLAALLVEALEQHGEVLTASEKQLAEENRQHLSEVEAALGRSMVEAAERQENLIRQSETLLKEMQVALVEAAGATVRQQEELVRQSDVLLKVVDATGQIKTLEDALHQNLAAVQKAHNFEEMAVSLSAAIQLLSARVGYFPSGVRSRDAAGGDVAKEAA